MSTVELCNSQNTATDLGFIVWQWTKSTSTQVQYSASPTNMSVELLISKAAINDVKQVLSHDVA